MLDGFAADEMLVDDGVDVADLEVPVPNPFGVDDHDGPLVVLLVATHARRADVAEFLLLDSVPQVLQELL